ncbi:hypothetical protein [Microcoleus sp. CZ3-B4]|uniref:hypothetical protein n=1 Tax=Microcoleus sp. CZ3-B4 TaxID=2818733 RepID=UPI002FD302DD
MPIVVIMFPVSQSPQTKRKGREQGKSPQTLNQRSPVDPGKFLLHKVNSQMNLSENISNITSATDYLPDGNKRRSQPKKTAETGKPYNH